LDGLAASCTLAARGYRVVLFEKSEWLGAKAAELHVDGYRVDMGPTILLMPSVLKRNFAEASRDFSQELELVRLDPQWRSFFADGRTLDLYVNPQRMAATLDIFAPSGSVGRGYRQFLDHSRRLDDISNRYFFWRAIGSLTDLFDPSTAIKPATLGDVLAMRRWSTVSATIRSYVDNHNVAQMLDHFTQYVESSPDNSPAVLCGIANMQIEEGIWYPRGGTRAVAKSLVRLARDLGVAFRTGAGVQSIDLDPAGGVAGLITDEYGHVHWQRSCPMPTRCELIAIFCAAGRRPPNSSAEGRMNRRVRASCSTWGSIAVTSICSITTSSPHATRTRNSTGFTIAASPPPTRPVTCALRRLPIPMLRLLVAKLFTCWYIHLISAPTMTGARFFPLTVESSSTRSGRPPVSTTWKIASEWSAGSPLKVFTTATTS